MATSDPRSSATGSTNPFDFDDEPNRADVAGSTDAGGTTDGGRSTGATSAVRRSDGFDPFGLNGGEQPGSRPRTGQRLSWTALILAVVGALLIGIGVGGVPASIQLTAHAPFGAVLWWATLALVGVLLVLIAVVGSIVGVVQAEPRRVAAIALIISIVAGWVAAYIGFRIGAHQLSVEAFRVVGEKGPKAVPAIESYLHRRGIEVGAYSGLLHRVFG